MRAFIDRTLVSVLALALALGPLAPAALAGEGAVESQITQDFCGPVWVQVAPTNGQVLTWSTANARWQAAASATTTYTGTANQVVVTGTVLSLSPTIVCPGTISCPGVGAGSERFGAGALSAGASGTAVGPSASATASFAVAVGYQSLSAAEGVSLGASSSVVGTGGVAIGTGATAGAHQFSSGTGHSSDSITDVYFGSGSVADSAPVDFTLHGSTGSGAAVAGGSVSIAGGTSGDAATGGGSVLLKVAKAGSGTSLTTAITIANDLSAAFAGNFESDGTISLGTSGTGDTVWARDGADWYAQRRSTNAQRLSIYNTYTSATNFERGGLDWQTASNTCWLHTSYGSAGGTPRQLVVGGFTAVTDVAMPANLLKSGNAYSQASTNTSGANTILAGGIGRRLYSFSGTVGNIALKVFTLTANGTAYTLTEGTDFNRGASMTTAALAFSNAVNAKAGLLGLVTATASSTTVYVSPLATCYSLTITDNQLADVPVTLGANGVFTIAGDAGSTTNLFSLTNDGTSKFSVTSAGATTVASTLTVQSNSNGGAITSSGGVQAAAAGRFNWGGFSSMASSNDGLINFTNTALTGFTGLTLGAVTPTGTDTAGASPYLAAGPGTGAGTGSILNFRVSPILATGSTVQTLGTVFSLSGVQNNLSSAAFSNGALATVSATFADGGSGSTGNFCGLYVAPTVNWTGTGAKVFTGLVVNQTHTSTTGATATNLADLQLAGTSVFKVSSTGSATLTGSAPNYIVGATGSIQWSGRGAMLSPADGIIELLNTAQTDFTRLQFGGTTSSFPSLKKNGTTIQCRLADDSADAPMSGQHFTAAAGGQLLWLGRSIMTGPADGQIQFYNNAGNGFQGLQLGNVTPTYPGSAPTHAQTATIGCSEELLTLSTSGTTTDTSASLLPANAIILSVTVRVTTTITTATDWSVGDPTTATRFSSANSTLTSGTTSVGMNQLNGNVTTTAAGPTQAAAAKVRITTTGTPGAGAVRITTHYIILSAATS